MEPDEEPQSHSSSSRLRRALALGAVSILGLALAGLSYLHPEWTPIPAGAVVNSSNLTGSRHLSAVDFVTPAIGWVVVERQPDRFVVLHTSDTGATWVRQLAGADGTMSEYLNFFNASNGVVAILGRQAVLYRTSDGGYSWSRQALTKPDGFALSADFIDADHGWLLAQASTEGEALLRTDDGGKTWVSLGTPVAYSDWAYRVVFTDRANGWLYSRSTGLYAYRSADGGSSWQQLALPGPRSGWPSTAGVGVSVEVRPTKGAGVSATVVIGQDTTYVQPADTSPGYDPPPENQYQLSSINGGHSWKSFSLPATHGATVYLDALDWWWIGPGVQARSTDAGSTWSPIRSLLVPAPLPDTVQMIDPTHVWFGAMAGTRPLVEGTDDGGVSWTMFLLPDAASGS
jgi:photosystem II stability/assembly factor-like uncharacterized protein